MAAVVALAIAAAVAFGLTTPLVALAGAKLGPFTIAAALYAGAALVSAASRPFTGRSGRRLSRADAGRLLLVAFSGAVAAPTLYAWGLGLAGPTATSLALNLEALFTAALAWILYREPLGRRVLLALALMGTGGLLVAARSDAAPTPALGVGLVTLATVAWAADSALSRGLVEVDPGDVVLAKGTLGASATAGLGLLAGEAWPSLPALAALLALGATGYGLSLRLYLLAQRRIGAARTGSVFAAGPFLGAALGWLLGDRGGRTTWLAAAAFLAGVLLHATERHGHRHAHSATRHEHDHEHGDGHHDHHHDDARRVEGRHTHLHEHEAVEHEHDHAPDLHHGHDH
jgi:drug/metabolite transporter (DMT)-like permease